MPLYEYRCEKCERVFEVIQKFSDAPLETHADCGGRVERLISAPGLHFKGSGWYITDYARSGKGGKEGKGKNANGESKSDSGSDSKSSSSSSDSSSSSTSESKPSSPSKSG